MRQGRIRGNAEWNDGNGSDDSFLDVVANVVGVLIILVMLVGAQASRRVLLASSETPGSEATVSAVKDAVRQRYDTESLQSELDSAMQAVHAAQKSLEAKQLHITNLSNETEAYDQQRVELAMHRSLIEADIESRKEQLDQQQKREFEVQRQLLEAKLDLDRLSQERLGLFSTAAAVTEIECVPTPLARMVEGESIHLRLRKGLVSVVPLEELLGEIQVNIEGLRRRLQESGRVVETFGPLDGYRLKFTVTRRRSTESIGGPLVGRIERSHYDQYAEILPISEEIGHNVEQALLPGGRLHQLLETQRRQKPAVVVWLYTDSFDEFRPLKRALWERGFSLATRPMLPGTPIAASPHGTRAAAQ